MRAAGLVERGYKWARRKPTLAAAYALTLAVFVLLGFGVSLASLWRTAEGARGEAETARDELAGQKKVAELARDGEKTARADAERAAREV